MKEIVIAAIAGSLLTTQIPECLQMLKDFFRYLTQCQVSIMNNSMGYHTMLKHLNEHCLGDLRRMVIDRNVRRVPEGTYKIKDQSGTVYRVSYDESNIEVIADYSWYEMFKNLW